MVHSEVNTFHFLIPYFVKVHQQCKSPIATSKPHPQYGHENTVYSIYHAFICMLQVLTNLIICIANQVEWADDEIVGKPYSIWFFRSVRYLHTDFNVCSLFSYSSIKMVQPLFLGQHKKGDLILISKDHFCNAQAMLKHIAHHSWKCVDAVRISAALFSLLLVLQLGYGRCCADLQTWFPTWFWPLPQVMVQYTLWPISMPLRTITICKLLDNLVLYLPLESMEISQFLCVDFVNATPHDILNLRVEYGFFGEIIEWMFDVCTSWPLGLCVLSWQHNRYCHSSTSHTIQSIYVLDM